MIRALVCRDGAVSDLDTTGIPAALDDEQAVVWVNVVGIDTEATALLSNVFHVHHLAIDDCTNGRVDTPKIDDYGDYLFIIAQGIDYRTPLDHLDLTEVDIFLGHRYVVTLSETPVTVLDDLFEAARRNVHFFSRGADFLAHTVLDQLVDLLLPAVEEMDETLDGLQERILDRPDRALMPQVLLLKRNTLRLRRSILPLRDMVNRLSRGEYGELIDREALIFYRDVYDHIVRVEEMLEGLRDLADSALNSYLSSVNNRMNEIMKALSVVSVIFLPLTLLASIFGTNLDYSAVFGLEIEGGFYLMIASMLALGGAMLAYFRYRGWF